MQSLDNIIDWADSKMLSGLKRKGEAVQPPMAPTSGTPAEMPAPKSETDLDQQSMQELIEAYEHSDEPVQINGSY